MRHNVDLQTWERYQNWKFMKEFTNSWYSITTEIDCTKAFNKSKAEASSFFIKYLYTILRAANEVKEFGYRRSEDGQEVHWYDTINATVPIAIPQKTFYTILVKYEKDYSTFYNTVKNQIVNIPVDGDPYGVNNSLIQSGDYGAINISATPKLYFTSITYTFKAPGLGSEWPLLNVGKIIERNNQKFMPMGIYVDHAFVDGGNLSDFCEKVQKYLDE